MGAQEAPGSDTPKRIRVWRFLCLPAPPEAAFSRPLLRASVLSH